MRRDPADSHLALDPNSFHFSLLPTVLPPQTLVGEFIFVTKDTRASPFKGAF